MGIRPRRTPLVAGAVAVSLLVVVLAGLTEQALGSVGTVQLANPGVSFVEATTDDRGADPGSDRDVATCTAAVDAPDTVAIRIVNAYPSYTCRLTVVVENTGEAPLRGGSPDIEAPAQIRITTGDRSCGELRPGGRCLETFAIHVEESAAPRSAYRFTIAQRFLVAEPGTSGSSDSESLRLADHRSRP